MSYDIKFRCQVLKIRDLEKLSLAKVAKRFGINKQTVYNWTRRLDEKKNRTKAATKIDMSLLEKDVEEHPDSYQYERAQRLNASVSGIRHALKRLGVTYKKNTQSPQSGQRKTICILRRSKPAQGSGT